MRRIAYIDDLLKLWEKIKSTIGGADWGENDPSSNRYVENRTHYTETESVTYMDEDFGSAATQYFDFSVDIVDGETYTMTITGSSTESFNTTEELTAADDGSGNIVLRNSNGISITLWAESRPSAMGDHYGAYNGPGNMHVNVSQNEESVVQLDDKYISENIARTSDIPTALSELTNDEGFLKSANNLADVSNRQTALNNLTGASSQQTEKILSLGEDGSATWQNRFEKAAGVTANEISIHDHRGNFSSSTDVYVPIMRFEHLNNMRKFQIEFSFMSADATVPEYPVYYARYVFFRSTAYSTEGKFMCVDCASTNKSIFNYDDVIAVSSTESGSTYTTFYKKNAGSNDWNAYCVHSMSTFSYDGRSGYVVPTYYVGTYANSLKSGEVRVTSSMIKSYSSFSTVYECLDMTSNMTQVQADWNQTDTSELDYIKNKPTIPTAIENLVDGSASGSLRSIGSATEDNSYTMGINAFAEGSGTKASGPLAHAEGNSTTASGPISHAEGSGTTASGYSSHAEGYDTTASGNQAHAEGYETTASGPSSHTEGEFTIANHKSQHVFGEYNIVDDSSAAASARGTYVEIVGNGTADDSRSNARTLDWDGNEELAGNLTVGGSLTVNGQQITPQAQSDWDENDNTASDFIKNRPFYQIGEASLIGEVVASTSMVQFELSTALIAGKTYTVNINGTDYSVNSAISNNLVSLATIAGNIYYDPEHIAAQLPNNAFIAGSANGQTIKIYNYVDIVKLNSKFLDGSLIKNGTGIGANIFNNSYNNNTASGRDSSAFGRTNTSSGECSASFGSGTTASGDNSHAEGSGTIANHSSQHVFGEYNIEDPSTAPANYNGTYIEIVGNGTSSSARSNARTLDWDGNEVLAGDLSIGKTSGDGTLKVEGGSGNSSLSLISRAGSMQGAQGTLNIVSEKCGIMNIAALSAMGSCGVINISTYTQSLSDMTQMSGSGGGINIYAEKINLKNLSTSYQGFYINTIGHLQSSGNSFTIENTGEGQSATNLYLIAQPGEGATGSGNAYLQGKGNQNSGAGGTVDVEATGSGSGGGGTVYVKATGSGSGGGGCLYLTASGSQDTETSGAGGAVDITANGAGNAGGGTISITAYAAQNGTGRSGGAINISAQSGTSGGSISIAADTITLNGAVKQLKKAISITSCTPDTYYCPTEAITTLVCDDAGFTGDYNYTFSGCFTAAAGMTQMPAQTDYQSITMTWYGDISIEAGERYMFCSTKVSATEYVGVVTKLV